MADTFSADIVIGGNITRTELQVLFDAIKADGAWDEDGAYPFDEDAEDWEPEPGKPLHLCDPEAAWGHFDDIEAACQEIGLRYVRWSEDGDKQVFDGKETHDVTCDGDGETVVTSARLRKFATREAALAWLELMDQEPPPLVIVEEPEGTTDHPGFQAIVEAVYGAAREVGADMDDPCVIRLLGDWLDEKGLTAEATSWLARKVVQEHEESDQ